MSDVAANQSLPVIDLGRMPYAEAFAEQRRVHGEIVARTRPATLLLVEHEPVITISRRKAAQQHLLANADTLARLGIDVQQTDRGGDITYHGPGQLVVYPIVRLSDLGLNVGRYIRRLERIIIDTVAAFGVEAFRVEKATGVWVDKGSSRSRLRAPVQRPFSVSNGATSNDEVEAPSSTDDASGEARTGNDEEAAREAASGEGNENDTPREAASGQAKLAAIGVRVSRNVSMHGLALNVATDLRHFDTIVPCGLANRAVASLSQLLGDAAPTLPQVKEEIVAQARRRLPCT